MFNAAELMITPTGGASARLGDLLKGKRSAAYHLVRKLAMGMEDASILVCGDSTMEWIWKFTDKLAAKFPAYTVIRYSSFSATGGGFGAVSTRQTGTGSQTLRIFEFSVGNSKPTYFLGCPKSNEAIKPANLRADLIWLNHGHNLAIPQSVAECIAPYLASCMRQIAAAHPCAPMIVTIQNPIQTDPETTFWRQAGCLLAARMLGAQPFDIYSRYKRAGKPAAWYLDPVHPSSLAAEVISDWAIEEFITNVEAPWGGVPAFGRFERDNLLANAQFDTFAGGAASGWTVVNGTLTEDSGTHETGSRAVTLTPAASGVSYIEQSISGAALARLNRQPFMVWARVRTPQEGSIATCPVEIRYDGAQVALSPFVDSGATRGSFFDHAAGWGGAEMDRTKNLTARIYVDSTGADMTSTSITIDRMYLGPMHGFQG